MDNIKSVVSLLSKAELEEFEHFLTRKKTRRARKDTSLLDFLKGDRSEAAALKKNANAYHALRNRLVKKIIQFISTKRIEEDLSGSTVIWAYTNFAEFLLEKGNEKLGWKYLLKSEEMAIENQLFDLLNMILSLQLLYAQSEYAPPLKEIILKKETSRKLHVQEDNAVMAYALVKERFMEMKISGDYINFQTVVDHILERFDLRQVVIERPKILYGLLEIVRDLMFSKKDFQSYEPFIVSYYQQADFTLNKRNHIYKLKILYLLAHVLYRNRKFTQCMKYVAEMEEELDRFDGAYENHFKGKVILLKAAIKAYSGGVSDSIKILEEGLESELLDNDIIKAKLNLVFYNSLLEKNDEALEWLNRLNHTEKWYNKKLGKEWVLKKNVMEIMLHCDLGNAELALSRIRSVQRNFSSFLKQPLYKRAADFISLVKKMIEKPMLKEDNDFMGKVEKKLVTKPEEYEDLQAMSFYAWLRARLRNKKYIDSLHETVKETAQGMVY